MLSVGFLRHPPKHFNVITPHVSARNPHTHIDLFYSCHLVTLEIFLTNAIKCIFYVALEPCHSFSLSNFLY